MRLINWLIEHLLSLLFLSCISCAACFFQQGYLDYFFLFIRNNEPETIDEDDTLEAGSLPNFRSGIHVKLPQRLLFVSTLETRAIFFFFFFFLRQFSTPKFLISFLFPHRCENVKKSHSYAFSSLFFLLSRSNEFRWSSTSSISFSFFFIFLFQDLQTRNLSFLAPSGSRAFFRQKIVIYFFFNRAVN